MPTYYDSQNKPFPIGERLGGGGEGTVYSCEDFGLVAKIYHAPVTEEKAEKLRWMAVNKNEQLLKVAAWVVDVLLDKPDGKVVGFLMPNVKAKEIHELYSLKSRRVYFPEATWHFLVHTAGNLARAFHNLHKNAHIMGDVNHGNCVVLADGTVKLIDCDSYSVKTDKMRYACEVGVATHLAPELQNVNLSEVEREDKHDNFGLAVIIFQLLFLGRHPFAGNYLGAEDKSIEECISEYRFAYGENAKFKNVKQPPGTLSLSAVSPRLALMFERAFLTEDRPEPREWIEALGDLSENLEQCGLHPGHFYFNELTNCPWCEIEAQTGLMLFPFVTGGKHADGEKPFNIFTVENLIASFGINGNLPAKPLLPSILPPPAKEIVEAKQANRKMMLISISTQFFGLIFLMAIFGVGIAFFLGICAMIFWIIYTNNSYNHWGDDPQKLLVIAETDWVMFENQWQQKALPQSLDDDLVKVRKEVTDYQKFQQESIRETRILQDKLAERELFRYLRSMSLDEAEIDGFTEQEKQWLIGKGIQTAAEISENRIRVFHDFNGAVVPKLLEWRNQLELEFAVAPRADNFKNEREEFVKEKARQRRRIETEIEHSLTILRSGAVNLRRRQQELSEKSANLGNRFLQAKSNAEALGSNAPAIVVLVLITILTPYFGFIVSQINAPRTIYSSSSGGSGYGSGSSGGIYSGKSEPLNNLNENITDQEISMLSDSQRTAYAEGLLMQTSQMSYGRPDYERDERKMRLAIRLKENDTRFLNQLGYALYEQQKYDESLKYLNRSLNIEKDNSGTKIFIAINYLRVKRFKDARAILTEVVEKYPTHFEGFYNLGLAETNLKNYAAAAKALQTAVNINPDDADANYELGISYFKLGDKIKVEEQYEKLLDLDRSRAASFWDEAKIAPQERIITRSSDNPPAKIGIK
jgi:DNA-binding helix-hairpin-helix protein with protein kinase domain/Flp pilus assembly protein TadD